MNKLFILISALLSLSLHAVSQVTPTWAWGTDYTGTVVSSIYHNDYVYVIGNYSNNLLQIGSISLSNGGGDDMYLAKLDTLGNLIWAKSISDTANQTAVAIHINSNNEIVVGGNNTNPSLVIGNDTITSGTNNGAFIATFDTSGNVLDALGVPTNHLTDFCIDNSNNMYAATSNGIYKYSNSNLFIWQKPIIVDQIRYSSASTSLMCLGGFEGILTYGGITITATYSPIWGPNNDIFCIQTDLNGNVNWFINVTNTVRADIYHPAYLRESTGDLFVPIMTFALSGQYASLRSISNSGIVGYLNISNAASGVVVPTLNPNDYPEIINISGKDSVVSYMLTSSGMFSYSNPALCLFNLNSQSTVVAYNCNSYYHLFNGMNSIYMKGYIGPITHTFGKLGPGLLTSPNTHFINHYCIGSTVNLTSNVFGGVAPLSYSWAPSTGLSSTTNSSTSFVASTNTSYTLTVTDANSQVVKDTFDILVDTSFSNLAITPQYPSFCHDSMYLYSNTGVNLNWHKFNGASWSNFYYGSNAVINSPGLFRAYIYNSCGTFVDSIQVLSAANVTASASSTEFCAGQSTTLNGNGALIYTWTGGAINNTQFSPTTTQTYTVTGTDSSGCIDTASIQITVHPQPTITTITATPAIICTGGNSILSINQPISYCTPTVTNAGTNGSYISNVNFGSGMINNTTGDGPGDYNYYSTTNANIIAGMIYPISISANYSGAYAESKSVWIDFNQDGIFDNLIEKVFTKDTFANNVSGNITIPMSVINGITRMRVAGKWYGNATPCNIDNYGEFEDYNITISGGVNYVQWTPSTFLSTTNERQVQATNVTNTTTYTATVNSEYGCTNTGTVTLTVNPTSASTTDITICASSLPYSWNSQTLSTSGVYFETFSNSYGCDSIATLNLIVNPLPLVAITPYTDSTICIGTSYVLHVDTSYSAYTWTWNGNIVSSNDSVLVDSSGTYIVNCIDTNGCFALDTVIVNILPSPQPIIIQNNYTLTCTNTSNLNYQWYFNGSLIGSNDSLLTITQDGQYIVKITDSAGCIGFDTLIVIGLGIHGISTNENISIYPNPSSDLIYIEFEMNEASPFDLKLYDAQGRVVWKKLIEEKTPGKFILQIDLNLLSLKPGVYMLSGRTFSNHWTKRIVYLDK